MSQMSESHLQCVTLRQVHLPHYSYKWYIPKMILNLTAADPLPANYKQPSKTNATQISELPNPASPPDSSLPHSQGQVLAHDLLLYRADSGISSGSWDNASNAASSKGGCISEKLSSTTYTKAVQDSLSLLIASTLKQ